MQEKRRTLSGIDLNIRQAVADLDAAMPVALLAAYGEELKGSVTIDGRADAARRITGILRPHGQAIGDLVRTLPEGRTAAPAFPKQTGVADTFGYIGHFLPIAAITAVVELVFPICLWLYTLFALSWSAHRVSPPTPRPHHPEDAFYEDVLPGPGAPRGGPCRAFPLSPARRDHCRRRHDPKCRIRRFRSRAFASGPRQPR